MKKCKLKTKIWCDRKRPCKDCEFMKNHLAFKKIDQKFMNYPQYKSNK